jgi:hypothetical protein
MRTALCLLLAAGCAANPPTVAYVHPTASVDTTIIPILTRDICADPIFDEEDQGDFKAAVEDWNRGFNGLAHLTFNKGPCQWRIILGEPDDHIGTSDITILAYANDIGGDTVRIFRDRIHDQPKLRQVMRHELGHLFGVLHTKDNTGLMGESWTPEKYQCVDEYALKSACRYQQITCKHIKPCVIK